MGYANIPLPADKPKVCRVCGKEYHRRGRDRRWFVTSKYCSHQCKGIANRGGLNPRYIPRPKTWCQNCGKMLKFPPHTQYRQIVTKKFCSFACRTAGQAPFAKERFTICTGYVVARLGPGQYRKEHIVIAERALGRKLRKGEAVHHINGDKADNRNSNLLVCMNGYHKWLHAEMGRRYAQEHFTS